MRDMRSVLLVIVLAAGCGSSGSSNDLSVRDLAVADLSPDPALLLGLWQEPGSGYIWRFTSDEKQVLAATTGMLESAPLTSGSWLLKGDTLLLDNIDGLCAAPASSQVGNYKITLSADQLVFKLVSDLCPERSTIDGETWTRSNADGG
jgi:hypothetical protein